MKKLFYYIIIPVFLFIFAASLYFYQKSNHSIGIVICTDSSLGNEANQAVRFYADDVKRRYPHLRFIIKNPLSHERAIEKACRELAASGVSLIIGGSLSSRGIIMYEALKSSGVPFLGITVSTEKLSGIEDNFFRICMPADKRGKAYSLLLNEREHKNVVVIKEDCNPLSTESFAGSFITHFKGKTTVLSYEEALKQKDYSPFDGIMCILPPTELVQILKKSDNAGGSGPVIYSSDRGFDEIRFLFSGHLLDGLTSLTLLENLDPVYAEMMKELESQTLIRPAYSSVTVFALLDLAAAAVTETAGSRKRLQKYFRTPKSYSTGGGKCSFNSFGDPVYEQVVIRSIKNGAVVTQGHLKLSD
jgi:ABC-type branched-subunit amino acid transport system substrate-binding protein